MKLRKLYNLLLIAVFGLVVLSCSNDKSTNPPTTPEYGTVTDLDGNTYKTVQIGTQTWMAENLKVSPYLNGDAIPVVTDPSEWTYLNSGARCYYNYDPSMDAIYGNLYNWFTVNDSRGLAPSG